MLNIHLSHVTQEKVTKAFICLKMHINYLIKAIIFPTVLLGELINIPKNSEKILGRPTAIYPMGPFPADFTRKGTFQYVAVGGSKIFRNFTKIAHVHIGIHGGTDKKLWL